ncbi:MAG: hypothetical protein KBA33_08100 [Cloacibacterium sp.]|nr:hypothetical protein [Cloacibacterium sp.]
MQETLICGLSATEIEQLKEEKGALVLIDVDYQGKKHQVIFREPSFKDMEAVNSISKSNEMKGLQAMYNNCIAIADSEVEKRDLLKIKAVESLMTRVQKISAEAKNL